LKRVWRKWAFDPHQNTIKDWLLSKNFISEKDESMSTKMYENEVASLIDDCEQQKCLSNIYVLMKNPPQVTDETVPLTMQNVTKPPTLRDMTEAAMEARGQVRNYFCNGCWKRDKDMRLTQPL
jgi:superfamily II DNA helicase RecQ